MRFLRSYIRVVDEVNYRIGRIAMYGLFAMMALRNVHRLRLGEDLRDLVGRDAGILQRRLDGPLVEPARLAGEVDAGILQKLSAMNARGSEYDPLGHCVRPVRPGLP